MTQVTQQLFTVNLRAAVLDLYRAPVRLMGDKAVGFQQMANQRLVDHFPPAAFSR